MTSLFVWLFVCLFRKTYDDVLVTLAAGAAMQREGQQAVCTCVEADVLKRRREVRHIWLPLHLEDLQQATIYWLQNYKLAL